jgi:hypothetical protein
MKKRTSTKSHVKGLHLSLIGRLGAETNDIELPLALNGNRKRAPIIGTLSFPVIGRAGRALRDNSDLIAEIILRRRPDLLLCAGWSVLSSGKLDSVRVATKRARTVAVLETSSTNRAYWRFKNGQPFKMGKQFFGTREETCKDPRCLTKLSDSLPERSFYFHGRKVILLICGEINLMQGRTNVHFHRSTPVKVAEALGAKGVLILNPTHTRMGNGGTIKAKRRFLSKRGRVYVSVSNWDVCPKKKKRAQWPSDTLHSVWHNGKCNQPVDDKKQSDEDKRVCFVYREWALPR